MTSSTPFAAAMLLSQNSISTTGPPHRLSYHPRGRKKWGRRAAHETMTTAAASVMVRRCRAATSPTEC